MKLKTLLILGAIVNAIFGLAFLLVPEAVTSVYGNTLSQGGIIFARLFGAAMLGFAALSWSARSAPESEARRSIVLGSFVYSALGFIVSLVSQLAGMVNALGWSTVVLFLLFALGFGYFQFMKPKVAVT